MRHDSTPRARTRARYFLAGAVGAICAVAATACGTVPASPGSAPSRTSQPPKVSLDITVSGPGVTAKHWTLRCDPAGGDHPDPAAACRVLLTAKDPFAPVPKGIMCPMIIVGTKVATVRGTFFGQHVDTTFTEGGCQLARWEKIGQIFN